MRKRATPFAVIKNATQPVTLGAVAAAFEVLTKISDQPLPAPTAYRLGKLTSSLQDDARLFNVQREKLIKEHGTERDVTKEEAATGMQGPVFEVDKEKLPAFMEKLQQVSEIQATVDARWFLTVESLSSLTLSSRDMMALNIVIAPEGKP